MTLRYISFLAFVMVVIILSLTVDFFYIGSCSERGCLNRGRGYDNFTDYVGNSVSGCPDILVRQGNGYVLLFSDASDNETRPPLNFDSLDSYKAYVQNDQAQGGKQCPMVYLREESGTQGDTIFRTYSSPFGGNEVGGATGNREVLEQSEDLILLDNPFSVSPPTVKPSADDYMGFDSHGLDIGKFTALDEIHMSTEESTLSENAMDPNWGGVSYTQNVVESGKFSGNDIYRTDSNPFIV